jgi:hypothetical protein
MKTLDYRVAVGLDYPALTAAFDDDCSAEIDPANWVYTEMAGPPVTTGGKRLIQLYGAACREFMVTRPHCIPRDLTKKFTIAIDDLEFPAVDPVYEAIVTVGTINSRLGSDTDPLRIVQHGSTTPLDNLSGADIGKLGYNFNGTFPSLVSNDLAVHDWLITYDPAGVTVLEIKRDGVVMYADGSSGVQPRPYYVMFGMLQADVDLTDADTRRAAAALSGDASTALLNGGTTAAPNALPIIKFSRITISCDSYETRIYPDWTTANAGGTTLDNAAAGERVSIDNETWAIIPKSQIANIHTTVGRSLNQPFDSFEVELLRSLASDPDVTPNLFKNDLFSHRPIVIDSRIGEDATSTWTDWRRHICGIIEPKAQDGMRISLSGRDRPSVKLDTFFARGYFDVDIDTSVQDGPADGALNGLTLDQIFQDLVDVADALYGDKLGATTSLLRLIDQAPQMLSSGGGALVSVLQEWVDRAAQELWREYAVSGDARYGRLRTNLWTLAGSTEYGFRGYGSTNPNICAPGISFINDPRKGPGQAYLRNDSPAVPAEGRNIEQIAVLGNFPTFAYPPNDRVLNDSYGQHADISVSSLLPLRDKNNNIIPGGVAMHRYRMENSFRRAIEFTVVGHNWMQPSQIVTIDDTTGTGITTAETWVIDNIDTTISGGTLKARIQCTSTDWLKAIRETM